MIKANELRIGNLVINAKGENIIVDNITIGICFGLPKTYKPIPLTEEILLKCGFEKRDVSLMTKEINDDMTFSFSIKDSRPLYVIIENMQYDMDNRINTTEIVIECDSLHQLQNIYFALTSEELDVTL